MIKSRCVHFLSIFLTIFSIFITRLPVASFTNEMNSTTKVVVIGAGPSGIAAATKLLEFGFQNVVILEAEGRIGGRIHTVPFGENVIDLGAQWCHGQNNNVVYEMVKDKDLLDSDWGTFFKFQIIKSNKEIVPDEIAQRLHNIAEILFRDTEGFSKYEGSMGAYYNERYHEIINQIDNIDINRNTAEQYYELFHKSQNSFDASDSLDEVSAKKYSEFWECEGDPLQNWKNKGYVTILRLLMKSEDKPNDYGVLNQRILLNKSVKEIEWNNEGNDSPNVKIKCNDNEIIEADHVICTVSLGVLKERHSEMFKPSLPERKQRAIEGLTLGTVDKIFLEFSPKFWPNDWYGLSLMWEEKDLKEIRSSNDTDWLEDVFGIYTVSYQPNILLAWTYGKNARKMETLSDDEVQKGLMFLLRKFLSFEVPEPVAIKRSLWYTNPNFRGSYSFISMKAEELDVSPADLAKPLMKTGTDIPIVLFAGEASHDHYYSTVHGAIESGLREAQRLADLYVNSPKNAQNTMKEGSTNNYYDILILGGGLAGLGAGYTLKRFADNTKKKFLILEAQNYLGGRVKTAQMFDTHKSSDNCIRNGILSNRIDAGAQWLHGEQNELYKLATKYKLLIKNGSEEGLGLYIREDGYIFEDFFRKKIDFIIGTILEQCENFISATIPTTNCINIKENEYPLSIEHYLEEKFNEYLQLLETTIEQIYAKQLYDWHKRFQIIDNSSKSLRDVSAKFWGTYSFNGESCQAHINFKNGFSSVITALQKEIGNERILMNKEISNINWNVINNQNNLIQVKTHNNEIYFAKHLIITFPLGVLKSEQKLFSPQLPRTIRNCIDDIGFEAINKIFLQFDHPWWEPTEGFQLIFNDSNYEDKPWTRYLSGFDILKPGAPNTLIGWVGSLGAIEMEKFTDNEIISHCIELLRKFTGIDIPYPIRFYCSRWGSNKNIRGGYSYISTKCDKSGYTGRTLSTPITIKDLISCSDDEAFIENFKNFSLTDNNINDKKFTDKLHSPIILFAGEACHERYFSTAHGAFHSGIEQAEILLKNI